jgi:hypothetical protein
MRLIFVICILFNFLFSITTAHSESLNAVIAALKGSRPSLCIAAPCSLSADCSIGSAIRLSFTDGGVVRLRGFTLTIGGSLDAVPEKIFEGKGRVVFKRGKIEKILPQWWGADGADTLDDAQALQAALSAAAGAEIPLSVPAGSYFLESSLVVGESAETFSKRLVITGYDANFRTRSKSLPYFLRIVAPAKERGRWDQGIYISGIMFKGIGRGCATQALRIENAQQFYLRDLRFKKLHFGISLYNGDVGSIETSIFDECDVGLIQDSVEIGGEDNGWGNSIHVQRNLFRNSGIGIQFAHGISPSFDNNEFSRNDYGIKLGFTETNRHYTCQSASIHHNRFESNIVGSIVLGSNTAQLTGCSIEYNDILAGCGETVFTFNNIDENCSVNNNRARNSDRLCIKGFSLFAFKTEELKKRVILK